MTPRPSASVATGRSPSKTVQATVPAPPATFTSAVTSASLPRTALRTVTPHVSTWTFGANVSRTRR